MDPDRERLEKLAQELIEGKSVDWDTVSDPNDPESTRSAIESLAQVQRLRGFAVDASARSAQSREDLPATGDETAESSAGWTGAEPGPAEAGGIRGFLRRIWERILGLGI